MIECPKNFICEKMKDSTGDLCVIVRGPFDSMLTYNFTSDTVLFSTLVRTNNWYGVMVEMAHAFAQDE
jgi:hypothetical protein